MRAPAQAPVLLLLAALVAAAAGLVLAGAGAEARRTVKGLRARANGMEPLSLSRAVSAPACVAKVMMPQPCGAEAWQGEGSEVRSPCLGEYACRRFAWWQQAASVCSQQLVGNLFRQSTAAGATTTAHLADAALGEAPVQLDVCQLPAGAKHLTQLLHRHAQWCAGEEDAGIHHRHLLAPCLTGQHVTAPRRCCCCSCIRCSCTV